MSSNERITEKVKEIIRKEQMTQKEFAAQLGLSIWSLNRRLRHKTNWKLDEIDVLEEKYKNKVN